MSVHVSEITFSIVNIIKEIILNRFNKNMVYWALHKSKYQRDKLHEYAKMKNDFFKVHS